MALCSILLCASDASDEKEKAEYAYCRRLLKEMALALALGIPLMVYSFFAEEMTIVTWAIFWLWSIANIWLDGCRTLLIIGGFFRLASAWNVLHRAQQQPRLATTGLYVRMRHPQYVGFALIMFGFLLQWPTLLTLIMFPRLLVVYIRLAKREETQVIREFGDEYRRYRARTPAFIPKR
jgi:protein-S-isoprenylcysteine O-methyltransferase Ste14